MCDLLSENHDEAKRPKSAKEWRKIKWKFGCVEKSDRDHDRDSLEIEVIYVVLSG
jgi:hypothetical protein